jgi:hypothetical protein
MHIVRAMDSLMESQRTWTGHFKSPCERRLRSTSARRDYRSFSSLSERDPANNASDKSAYDTYSWSEKFNVGVSYPSFLSSLLTSFPAFFVSSCFYFTSPRSILILSTHLRLGLPGGLFPSGFLTNNLHVFLFSPFVLHASPISSSSALLFYLYLTKSTLIT